MLLQIIIHRFQTTKVVCVVKIYAGQLLLICESVAFFVSCYFLVTTEGSPSLHISSLLTDI